MMFGFQRDNVDVEVYWIVTPVAYLYCRTELCKPAMFCSVHCSISFQILTSTAAEAGNTDMVLAMNVDVIPAVCRSTCKTEM